MKTTLLKLLASGLSLYDGMRYLFIHWRRNWLEQMDKDTRKFHTMYEGLHSKSNVSRIYLLQDAEERGLIGLKDYFGGKQKRLAHYPNYQNFAPEELKLEPTM